MSSRSLLVVLISVIPIAALLAGFAAFLLFRAGFGLLVSGALPFLGLTLVAVALGLVLGRAAEAGRRRERENPKSD